MNFTGKIADVNIDFQSRLPKITFICNDIDVLNQLEEIKDKEKLNVEVKQWREKRSLDANAYFHVLVNKLARKLGTSDTEMKVRMNLEYGTCATNDDGTKVGIKIPYGTHIEQFYPYCKKFGESEANGLLFEHYLLYKETHTLDSKEMSQLIDGVVSECKAQGIEVLPNDEIQNMLKGWGLWWTKWKRF